MSERVKSLNGKFGHYARLVEKWPLRLRADDRESRWDFSTKRPTSVLSLAILVNALTLQRFNASTE
jgi:hypothetical protein